MLLGMLFAVALGLLDERIWGTFDRVRRCRADAEHRRRQARVAMDGRRAQMTVLFAVGFALFRDLAGSAAWALLLPIVASCSSARRSDSSQRRSRRAATRSYPSARSRSSRWRPSAVAGGRSTSSPMDAQHRARVSDDLGDGCFNDLMRGRPPSSL
jgi:uncharacterized membrane protein